MELRILTHPDLRHTARVSALIDFLYEALSQEAALFEGRGINARAKYAVAGVSVSVFQNVPTLPKFIRS